MGNKETRMKMEEGRIKNEENEKRSNVIRKKADRFSVDIVSLPRKLKENKIEAALVNQLLRSGTSISANVEESNDAISRAEFSAKISLAFKEARENQYWLNLLHDTGSFPDQDDITVNGECDEILRLLWAILKKTRMNK